MRVTLLKIPPGIGKALAEKFIANGAYVIASGRRKEKLDELVQQYGQEKVSAVPFDITNLGGIDTYAKKCVYPISRMMEGFGEIEG